MADDAVRDATIIPANEYDLGGERETASSVNAYADTMPAITDQDGGASLLLPNEQG
jgi:hypothetical protein